MSFLSASLRGCPALPLNVVLTSTVYIHSSDRKLELIYARSPNLSPEIHFFFGITGLLLFVSWPYVSFIFFFCLTPASSPCYPSLWSYLCPSTSWPPHCLHALRIIHHQVFTTPAEPSPVTLYLNLSSLTGGYISCILLFLLLLIVTLLSWSRHHLYLALLLCTSNLSPHILLHSSPIHSPQLKQSNIENTNLLVD